jgi:hypothetical protein
LQPVGAGADQDQDLVLPGRSALGLNRQALGMFEILDSLFMLFGRGHGGKSTQVFSFIGFGILAARIDPELAGL